MEVRCVGGEAAELLAGCCGVNALVHVNRKAGKKVGGGGGGGGDLYFTRDVTDLAEKNLKGKELTDQESIVDVMEKRMQGTIFSRAFLNPQGQLCLDLNRPVIFQKTLSRISENIGYGTSSPHRHDGTAISLLHCPCSIRLACDPSQVCTSSVEEGVVCSCHGRPDKAVSLDEIRFHLLAGAVANILQGCGYSISHDVLCELLDEEVVKSLTPSSSVAVAATTATRGVAEVSPGHTTPKDISTSEFISSVTSSSYLDQSVTGAHKGRWIDAHRFLHDLGLTGLRYDKNIKSIQVADQDGLPTSASHLAVLLRARVDRTHRSCGQRQLITCHMTPSSKTFLLQQALVLMSAHEDIAGENLSVHSVVPCQGVRCSSQEERSRDPPAETSASPVLADLVRIRTEQVSSLYAVRYPELFQGEELRRASSQIARAAIVFELLSTDARKKVCIKLPNVASQATPSGGGAGRFDDLSSRAAPAVPGTFVLYNYARLSSLLRKHQRLVQQGMYPPLPGVGDIDCSLFTSEVEWQLLFHHLLHFPELVEEVVKIKTETGGGTEDRAGGGGGVAGRSAVYPPLVSMEVSVNKICLFLVNLAHRFSSYYSQTKILMTPEPHLIGLINARLHLASAIKQVMLNAFKLLGITPLDEL